MIKSQIKYKAIKFLKQIIYGIKGEPYYFYGKKLKFKIGTRPFRLKYEDSPHWDVRNDVLQIKYLKTIFTENSILWDIGGCFGEYSILASSLLQVKTNKIFCFEPDPIAYKILKENLVLNNMQDSVQLFDYAVSDKTGTIIFENLNGNANSHIRFSENTKSINSIEVNSFSLDDLMKKIPKPTIIKMDIEGAELKVLNVENELIKDHSIQFLVELHPFAYPEFKADYEKFVQKLRKCNRTIKLIDPKKNINDLPFYGTIIF